MTTRDLDAGGQLMLADLNIKGRMRKVVMQAPKNGIFYVLDRVTGEFISAAPFVQVNWTNGFDENTGGHIINQAGCRLPLLLLHLRLQSSGPTSSPAE